MGIKENSKNKLSRDKELARTIAIYKVPVQVLQGYGLVVSDIQPIGRLWKLTTNRGLKALKKISYEDNRVVFIHSLLDHLANKGFSRTCRFIRTEYNTPFIRRENDYYFLSDWVEGRECNFRDSGDLMKAIEELALFHRCAEGMNCCELEAPENWGTWQISFESRVKELNQFQFLAQKAEKKKLFHQIFLDYYPYFMEHAQKAVEMLEKSPYFALVEEGRQKKSVCHRNFIEENLIIDSSEKLNIFNFDYAMEDLKIYDLGSLMQRVMIKNRWDFDLAVEILGYYEGVYPLEPAELEVLLAVLHFPHQMWLCASRFFKRQQGWSEKSLVVQFKNIIGAKKAKEQFLLQMAELVKSRKEEQSYGG